MSRSGYSDDCDNWALIKWRGAVTSAIRGKRGQQFLRDLIAALDAMPVKRLIAEELETESGEVCTLGSIGKARGIDMSDIDPYDRETVAAKFQIAEALAAEIMFENDEMGWWSNQRETPEQRWQRMRKWASDNMTLKERR